MVDFTGDADFSDAEVTKFLEDEGFARGTNPFVAERNRRFYLQGRRWFERSTWDGSKKTPGDYKANKV